MAAGGAEDPEWAEIRRKANAYSRDFLRNKPLKALVKASGGKPEERAAYAKGRAAYRHAFSGARRSCRAAASSTRPTSPTRWRRSRALREDSARYRHLSGPARRAELPCRRRRRWARGAPSSSASRRRWREYACAYQRRPVLDPQKMEAAQRNKGEEATWRRFMTPPSSRGASKRRRPAGRREYERLKLNRRNGACPVTWRMTPDGAKRARYEALREGRARGAAHIPSPPCAPRPARR